MQLKILYGGVSLKGKVHVKSSQVCQDKFFCKSDNNIGYLAVADGASIAKYSHLGADSVIFNTYKLIRGNFENYYQSNPFKVKRDIINSLLNELNSLAVNKKSELKEFASTLLFIAIKGNKIIAGHVGDGLIAYRKFGKYKILSSPLNGEFLNQTYFVTSKYYLHHFRIYRGEIRGIDKFFLMTDGVTQAYYSRKDNALNKKFESDIKDLKFKSKKDLSNSIKILLEEKILNQTHDDSTLVAASIIDHTR